MTPDQKKHVETMAYDIRRYAETVADSMLELEKCMLQDEDEEENDGRQAVYTVFLEAMHTIDQLKRRYYEEWAKL